jgi:alpha-L-rhamnosidase
MDNERYIFDRKLVDVVDWPQGERDGHVLVPVNTVVNAYHYRSLVLMARMAEAIGKTSDAKRMREAAAKVRRAANEKLVDGRSGIYTDGEGTTHSSLHSNMFPLAFGLVPPERRAAVVDFVKSRGMACSVYGSHHLLEALYRAGEADYALALLTSTAERGWAHMIDVGSTISLEAWDDRFKPNQDWNHAWGAAPASAIPRWLMGIRPLAPGFGEMLIQPQPGSLTFAEMTLPTIRGAVQLRFENRPGERLHLEVDLPGNTKARVGLPRFGRADSEVSVDGRRVCGTPEGDTVYVEGVGSGPHALDR